MNNTFPLTISVGIHTSGFPRLTPLEDGTTYLENMLIGKDFHWEKEISAILPGEVEVDGGILINRLPIERYLECVVGSEMNPNAPIEFLKAHAIISRSWAVGKVMKNHPEDDRGKVDSADCLIGWDDTSQHQGFDVCSDYHCQRYQGVQPISAAAREAIRSTEGMVICDSDGNPVDARFSKCCGGRTELFSTCWQDREMAGIESFEDPWCNLSGLPEEEQRKILESVLKDYDLSTGGGYRWTTAISKSDVRRNLRNKFGRDVGEIISVTPEEWGLSGRLRRIRIKGSGGEMSLGKELWIRRLFSESHLYSSAIEMEDTGDEFVIHGRGWGHGAGLCQIGAAHMAMRGADCEEILRFYYPGELRIKKEDSL